MYVHHHHHHHHHYHRHELHVDIYLSLTGVPAYGDAANLILEAHTKPNNPRLVAIVAYYPSKIPSPHTKFPASVQILVHLAGAEIRVEKQSQALGIQGKKYTVKKVR
jgi:hypothetical protein